MLSVDDGVVAVKWRGEQNARRSGYAHPQPSALLVFDDDVDGLQLDRQSLT